MDDVRAERMSKELIGKSVGQWELIKYLGCGKSALVFKAMCNGQEGAVKIFDPELIQRFGKDIQLQRIQRELLLRNKAHDHLINIIDGGECSITNHLFLVMNCLDLPTLEDVIKFIPYNDIYCIISQIASAAQYLESLNLCHRDIKPSNIVITPDYKKSILLDLGVLRPIGSSNLTDQNAPNFIGTLRYSSPEFLMRKEIDSIEGWRAVTFYQLGAVLHDLIMKKPLFDEYSEPYARLVEAVNKINPVIESDDAPQDLVHLAKTCLIKDPRTRLELIQWNSFSFDKRSSQSLETTKERIRQRYVANQSYLSDQFSPLEEQETRHHERIQKKVLDMVDMGIRLKCTGNVDFPPREIRTESNQIIVTFPSSAVHQLSSSLYLIFKIGLLDVDTEAILLSCMSFLGNEIIEIQQMSQEGFQSLFSGAYQKEIINDRIENFLYLSLDSAQQFNVKSETDVKLLGPFEELGGIVR